MKQILPNQNVATSDLGKLYEETVKNQVHHLSAWIRRLNYRNGHPVEEHDIVNETFVRLGQAMNDGRITKILSETIGTDEPSTVLRKWTFVTARHVMLEHLRKCRRDRILANRLELGERRDLVDPELAMIELRDAILQCPCEEQDVIVLFFNGYNVRETASVLQISRSTVARRLEAAKARLRSLLH